MECVCRNKHSETGKLNNHYKECNLRQKLLKIENQRKKKKKKKT